MRRFATERLLPGDRRDIEFGPIQRLRERGGTVPAVVFVTAHDRYAIQAFEINAIDYLLKPVTEERFAKALARFLASGGSETSAVTETKGTFTVPATALRAVLQEDLYEAG